MPRFIILDGSTIREEREGEEIRPKKRQRVDEENGQPATSERGSLLVRDPVYYFESNQQRDCVLKVENTLFKVSEDLFPLTSTIRYKLLQYGGDGRRTSDDEPLELLSASADQFRALLWALCILPKDIENHLRPKEQSDIDRLLALTTIAHKYTFPDLREKSLSAIQNAFTAGPVFADTCSSATFATIIDASVDLSVPDLQASVLTKWSARLQRRDIPALPAITTADKHSLRRLRGIAYYVHAQELFDQHPHVVGAGVAQLFADPRLSSVQTVRLLAGCMSLVTLWERLRRTPPKLPCALGCGPAAHRACVVTWNEQWHCMATSGKTLRHGSVDVLAILATVREQLAADQELVEKVTPGCRKSGLEGLETIAADLLRDLPDHFLGCI